MALTNICIDVQSLETRKDRALPKELGIQLLFLSPLFKFLISGVQVCELLSPIETAVAVVFFLV